MQKLVLFLYYRGWWFETHWLFCSVSLQQAELGLTAVFGPPASLPRFSEFFLKFVEKVIIWWVVLLLGEFQRGAEARVLVLYSRGWWFESKCLFCFVSLQPTKLNCCFWPSCFSPSCFRFLSPLCTDSYNWVLFWVVSLGKLQWGTIASVGLVFQGLVLGNSVLPRPSSSHYFGVLCQHYRLCIIKLCFRL